MERIETRTQLINYVHDHIDRHAIKAAIHEGKVFVVGGFRLIPPTLQSGWIVSITSKFGRVWNAAVTQKSDRQTFKILIVDKIPWKYYVGSSNLIRGQNIYDGDDPDYAALMAYKSRQDATKTDAAANATGKNKGDYPQL